MVNEETFKQIYAQFFPHGGESNLEKDPARPLLCPAACLCPSSCSWSRASSPTSGSTRARRPPYCETGGSLTRQQERALEMDPVGGGEEEEEDRLREPCRRSHTAPGGGRCSPRGGSRASERRGLHAGTGGGRPGRGL